MTKEVPFFFSGLSPLVPVLTLLLFGILFTRVESVAECMSGNSVKCFECNSREDFRCNDPFNWTTLPPVEDCTGCCVKMVQDIGTESASLKRTCTSNIRINFFMVGHVCMSESNNRGHMCFCEADLCNGSDSFQVGILSQSTSQVLIFLLLFLIQCVLLYPVPVDYTVLR